MQIYHSTIIDRGLYSSRSREDRKKREAKITSSRRGAAITHAAHPRPSTAAEQYEALAGLLVCFVACQFLNSRLHE